MLTDLRLPGQFEAAAEFVSPEDIDGHVRVSSDPGEHVEWLLELGGLGFERLYIHNVNLEQEAFIQDYGKHVLPALVNEYCRGYEFEDFMVISGIYRRNRYAGLYQQICYAAQEYCTGRAGHRRFYRALAGGRSALRVEHRRVHTGDQDHIVTIPGFLRLLAIDRQTSVTSLTAG